MGEVGLDGVGEGPHRTTDGVADTHDASRDSVSHQRLFL
jgi:hypothetical protein